MNLGIMHLVFVILQFAVFTVPPTIHFSPSHHSVTCYKTYFAMMSSLFSCVGVFVKDILLFFSPALGIFSASYFQSLHCF